MTTLLVLGNTNEHTFANSIIAANLMSIEEFTSPLREVYVLHTPESHRVLTSSSRWVEHLALNNIDGDVITHRTIDIGMESQSGAITKFSRFVEVAVRASEGGQLVVDLTNGTTAHKTLLSTVAYILDVAHLYSLDVSRIGKPPGGLGFLDGEELRRAYVRSPDSTSLDAIAHLSLTEVVRYRRIVEAQAKQYVDVNPVAADPKFFSDNLLHSIRMKLQGDRSRPRDNALYRIASSSIAASVEDLIRLVMTEVRPEPEGGDKLTFGERLGILRNHLVSSPRPDFDHEFLRRFNDFMLYLRNSTTHKGRLLSSVEQFKADLAIKMSFPFLEFYAEIVHPLLSDSTTEVNPTRIRTLSISSIPPASVFLVGLDGDDTGAILEDLFLFANDEKRFRELSGGIEQALQEISRRVRLFNKKNSVIFAAGDDVLFRGHIDEQLLVDLQQCYASNSAGHTCSIGFGKTFREVYVALKLAKTKPGKNSIIGVELC